MQSGNMTPLNCGSYNDGCLNRVDFVLITKLKCSKRSTPIRCGIGVAMMSSSLAPCAPFEDMGHNDVLFLFPLLNPLSMSPQIDSKG